MARDDALQLLRSEFKLWGVSFDTRRRGTSHIELRWRVSPDKEIRSYFISSTPSDHRGWLNARSDIRRLFRSDGLELKEPHKKPKPSVLQKALSLPVPIESDADQIKIMRAELADLTDLVLDMSSIITLLREHIINTPEEPDADRRDESNVIEITRRSISRSIKTLEHIGEGWNSLDAIAQSMGLPPRLAYRKLYYERSKGTVEQSGDRWRRKPRLELAKG